MAMTAKQFDQYELNEQDIDKTIRALSVHYGEPVTPEEAIDFLIWSSAYIHSEVQHGRKVGDINDFIKDYPRLKDQDDASEW
ncbi:MAG: hypothetical protein NVSMB39_4900 [Candidatus Saccharimonadales bacterium]